MLVIFYTELGWARRIDLNTISGNGWWMFFTNTETPSIIWQSTTSTLWSKWIRATTWRASVTIRRSSNVMKNIFQSLLSNFYNQSYWMCSWDISLRTKRQIFQHSFSLQLKKHLNGKLFLLCLLWMRREAGEVLWDGMWASNMWRMSTKRRKKKKYS